MTSNLGTANEFIARHIGPNSADEQGMLHTLGFDSLEAMTAAVIPESIKGTSVLGHADGQSEADALAALKTIAARNVLFKSFIGQGYYNTHTPAPILRNLLENPAWYTAYTPYQPEISQGRLEALLNFQTLISDLTGLPIANASLLDEATAAAEAMTFCKRLSKNKASNAFFASVHCHPQTLDVLRTRAEPLGIDVVVGDEFALQDTSAYFGALLQYPASHGAVFDYREVVQRLHDGNALVAVAADLLALTLLTPPGEFGADVAIGSAQRRWALAVHTRRTSPLATHSSATCRAAWSACLSTASAKPPCAWPCRPASSTSVARRPPATSAPPRCCWPTSPACTPSITAPPASSASPNARIR